MASFHEFSHITNKVPYFKSEEKKREFLEVLGALVLRIISLRKASEILDIEEQVLLKILDDIGYPFSYLEDEDVEREKVWKV